MSTRRRSSSGWFKRPRGNGGAGTGVEGKGKEETAGRYSFAVPAVVIYLKPLAVNISPSFIQRNGEAPAGGRGRRGRGRWTGEREGVSSAFLLTLALPSYLKSDWLRAAAV